MLSRLCYFRGLNLARYTRQFNVPVALASTCKTKVSKTGGSSGQRDLINFPRPTRLEKTPPVVFGFLPKSWFDFFYSKTGITGGYTFVFSLGVFLFSKEYIVIDPEFMLLLSYITLCILGNYKSAPIKEFLEKKQMERIKELDLQQEEAKQEKKDEMEFLKKSVWQLEGLISMLPEAKRENILLQQEAVYRSYLKEAHLAVLNILNYNVERSNIERQFLQKNLTSWILYNVEKAITPDIKKVALEKAISDLKAISVAGSG